MCGDAHLRIASVSVVVPGEGIEGTQTHPPATQLLCAVTCMDINTQTLKLAYRVWN